MKKLLIAASCAIIALSEGLNGCKEIGPAVNLTPAVGSSDSIYSLTSAQIATLATDPHNVLVEEFTGQACNNCPSAHATLANFAATNPGRINIIGLYLYNIPQAVPPSGSVYDFRDSTATNISTTIFGGIGALPSGGIDRLQSGGVIINDRTLWSGNITSQKDITDSVNLKVQSSYNTTTMLAKIVATVTYTQPVSTKQNLSVVIVEDGMIGIQEYPAGVPPFPTGHDDAYRFTDVFRGMVSTAPSGDPLLDTAAVKTKGTVVQRTFYYKLRNTTPAIIPDSCKVIAFINRTATGNPTIMQSAQVKLK